MKKQVKKIGGKVIHAKVNAPKPPDITPLHEETLIISMRKQKIPYKKVQEAVNQDRKNRGLWTGKGLSTNTISKLTGKKYSKEKQKENKEIREVYENKERQYKEYKDKPNKISRDEAKHSEKITIKGINSIINNPKGDQGILDIQYLAETDEYYVVTP